LKQVGLPAEKNSFKANVEFGLRKFNPFHIVYKYLGYGASSKNEVFPVA